MKKVSIIVLALVAIYLLAVPPVLGQGGEGTKSGNVQREHFAAMAYGQTGAMGGKAISMSFIINEYSADQEVHQLAQILREGGQEKLLSALGKLNGKGRIASVNWTGCAVRVIRQRPTEKGRRVFLLTDRPIAIYEVKNRTRSRDYPFGLAILDLDANNKGEGVLYAAAKIKFDKDDQLEIEHYGIDPFRLANVHLRK